jgi:hypothetical protein
MIRRCTADAAPERPRRALLALLVIIAGVVGLGVWFASWGFLEGVHQLQQGVFVNLPRHLP